EGTRAMAEGARSPGQENPHDNISLIEAPKMVRASSVSASVRIAVVGPLDRRKRQRQRDEAEADHTDERPARLHPRDAGQRRADTATDEEQAGVKPVEPAARPRAGQVDGAAAERLITDNA